MSATNYRWQVCLPTTDSESYYISSTPSEDMDYIIVHFKPIMEDMKDLNIPPLHIPTTYSGLNGASLDIIKNGCVTSTPELVEYFSMSNKLFRDVLELAKAYCKMYHTMGVQVKVRSISMPLIIETEDEPEKTDGV